MRAGLRRKVVSALFSLLRLKKKQLAEEQHSAVSTQHSVKTKSNSKT
jgi:hypothetical protein